MEDNKMATIGDGNVETYVRELLSEYFDSEAEENGYSYKGSSADNSSGNLVLNQEGLVKGAGESGKTQKKNHFQ